MSYNSKIFTKNTIKLGYSCCRNISSKISSNDRRIINRPPTNYGCNCRNRSNCPHDNKCLTPSIVYRATVLAIHKPDKKFSKTTIITIREILDTKNRLIARNCLNKSGN